MKHEKPVVINLENCHVHSMDNLKLVRLTFSINLPD